MPGETDWSYYVHFVNSDGEYSENAIGVGDRMHEAIKSAKKMAMEHCPSGGWCGWEVDTAWGMCLKSGRVEDDGKRIRDVQWPFIHQVVYEKRKAI